MRFRVANTDGQGVNLRSAPNVTAGLVTAFPEGSILTGDEHAWRHVTDAAGDQGWIANEFLAPSDDGKFRVANTGGQGANLRADPGMAGPRIGTLPDGALLSAEEHGFRHVTD